MNGPKEGDTLLHCGHLKKGTTMSVHLIRYEDTLPFSRPDGSRGVAQWFASCDECFLKHGMKVADSPRGDLQWESDEPSQESMKN